MFDILYQQAEFDFNNASSPASTPQLRHVAPHNSDIAHISLCSNSLMMHADRRSKYKFYLQPKIEFTIFPF